ncbi:MAG TPA: phosphocholine cytidylyltransferase family protein [Vicinamibacterales bacterium]|nr:phosphocholine cytidylyltransferase family protein [Vicinamibacterales bacterium]
MFPTRAVILAAGNGKRMGSLTADRPKAMLEVDGRSLIERSLDALAACGIADVTIVAGYQQQRLRDHLGASARFVDNPRYRDTNSLYSLWLAREVLLEGAVVMNSDILVSPELLLRLVAAPVEDAALIDESSPLDDETMKVKTWQGFAIDFSKELAPWDADGENVGVLKFGARGGRRLAAHLDALIAAGAENAWAPMAFRALAQEWPLRAVTTDGWPWTEIDFPADLDRARQIVVPAMSRAPRRKAA